MSYGLTSHFRLLVLLDLLALTLLMSFCGKATPFEGAQFISGPQRSLTDGRCQCCEELQRPAHKQELRFLRRQVHHHRY